MGEPEDSMPAWAVRLETKVDLVLSQHSAKLDDHEARLRELDAVQKAQRFITPAQFWAGLLGAVAGASGLVTLVNWLIGLRG